MGLSLRAAWETDEALNPSPRPPCHTVKVGAGAAGGPAARADGSHSGTSILPSEPAAGHGSRGWRRVSPSPQEGAAATSPSVPTPGETGTWIMSMLHTVCETRTERRVPTHHECSRCTCSHRALWRGRGQPDLCQSHASQTRV